MEFKPVKLTKRQVVLKYAKMHGLRAHGSDRKQCVFVGDGSKKGHESELWSLPLCETWDEAHGLLRAIEEKYVMTLEPRPWEKARASYTGKVKVPVGATY